MEVDKVNGIIEKAEEDGDKMVDDEAKINRKSLRREESGQSYEKLRPRRPMLLRRM